MEPLGLPRLDPHPNVSQVVYEALKSAIVEQRLASGSRLVESTLAGNFGVSTTPVREALTRLEREGLVSLLPRRGAVVSTFTAEDARDIGELREVLELHAFQRAWARWKAEHSAQLQQLLAEGQEVVDRGDYRGYGRFDQEFHRLIVQASGNRRLIRVFEMMRDQFQMVRFQAVRLPGRPDIGHREHQQIVAALVAGDGEGAERLLRAHIRHTVEDVCRFLSGGQEQSDATGAEGAADDWGGR